MTTEKLELDREELMYFLTLMNQERIRLNELKEIDTRQNIIERLQDNKYISDKIQSIINIKRAEAREAYPELLSMTHRRYK